MTLRAGSRHPVYVEPDDHNFGPSWGLDGADLALWRCYALTGIDLSDGPYRGWHEEAVAEVQKLRSLADDLERVVDKVGDAIQIVRSEFWGPS